MRDVTSSERRDGRLFLGAKLREDTVAHGAVRRAVRIRQDSTGGNFGNLICLSLHQSGLGRVYGRLFGILQVYRNCQSL